MAERKRGLGRGLSALIGEAVAAPGQAVQQEQAQQESTQHEMIGLRQLGIDQLRPGRFQPRVHFDVDELQTLAASIGKSGVLQPLLVRPVKDAAAGADDQFEIIAGERRWRAAQIAQLHTVPVLVKALSNAVALEMAIVENVQRTDLNPIEESEAYQRLIDEFAYTQADLAQTIGKSRSHIANILRLQSATPGLRALLIDGKLSMGHARALLGHNDADTLAHMVVRDGLSVRAVEALAAGGKKSSAGHAGKTARPVRTVTIKDADTRALEKTLADALGLTVQIDDYGTELGTGPDIDGGNGRGGCVRIDYKSLEQLDGVVARLLAHH